jgi:SAM-dependent methyltransferase
MVTTRKQRGIPTLNKIAAAPIADMNRYNARMAESVISKVSFLDKVFANLIVDYGCADGTVLDFIERAFPGSRRLVGYDNDPEMIAKARARNPDSAIIYTSDWSVVQDEVAKEKALGHKSCLLLNSVLHEVHSYLTPEETERTFDEIWSRAGVVFDYIAIRDMMVRKSASRASDQIHATRVRQLFNQNRLEEWEAQWGSIDENWSLTHLMLTYRYVDNWKRELKENYLPIPFEDFVASIPREYMPTYKDHFTLPFLRHQVHEDFGIDLAEPTHVQLILKHVG